MIAVQAVDGKFYIDPMFWGKTWCVKFEDGPVLYYKQPSTTQLVSWKTARKVLRPAGLAAKIQEEGILETDTQVLNGLLVRVSAFGLRLTGPISVPMSCSSVLDSEPAPGDFEIISFRRKKRC